MYIFYMNRKSIYSLKNSHYLFISILISIVFVSQVQANPNFDLSLGLDYESAEKTLDYFDFVINSSQSVTELRGNRLVAATSELLARTEKSADDFQKQLELARNNIHFDSDIYGFHIARKHTKELRKLCTELKRRRVDRKIVATLASFFPEQAKISTRFSVYFVVVGNERAGAFVRHVVWKFDTPIFVSEEKGEPIIVVNLASVVGRITDMEAQILEILSITAHECFHSVFSVLQKSLPKSIQARNIAEQLLDIVQNEGVAYYLSMQTHIGTEKPSYLWFEQTSNAIRNLNIALFELYSPNLKESRARELLMNANLSGSFESNYGATAGLRMAYEIDKKLGRQALTETLMGGCRAFVLAYKKACQQDNMLPKIDDRILKLIE